MRSKTLYMDTLYINDNMAMYNPCKIFSRVELSSYNGRRKAKMKGHFIINTYKIIML